jgi:hypothetical protein
MMEPELNNQCTGKSGQWLPLLPKKSLLFLPAAAPKVDAAEGGAKENGQTDGSYSHQVPD